MAIGGRFGRLEFRNARTGALVHRPVPDGMFSAGHIAVSPDGSRLVVCGRRRVIHVRDVQTGNLLTTLATPQVAAPAVLSFDTAPPENSILGADFSPDSQHVFGACFDGRVRKWDATSGAELASFLVSEDYIVMDLAVFDGGNRALCGISDATAKVIQLSDGAELHVLRGHERFLTTVAVSPDGTLLVTGDQAGRVNVWSAENGQLLHELPKHRSMITRLRFAADGSMLASSGYDGLVKIWRTSDGGLLHELRHLSDDPSTLAPAYSATFAPTGSRIVTISEREVRFWDASDGSSIDWSVPESAFARDCAWVGDKLVFGRRDGTVLMVSVP
jgi:WD40 repeat protein